MHCTSSFSQSPMRRDETRVFSVTATLPDRINFVAAGLRTSLYRVTSWNEHAVDAMPLLPALRSGPCENASYELHLVFVSSWVYLLVRIDGSNASVTVMAAVPCILKCSAVLASTCTATATNARDDCG